MGVVACGVQVWKMYARLPSAQYDLSGTCLLQDLIG